MGTKKILIKLFTIVFLLQGIIFTPASMRVSAADMTGLGTAESPYLITTEDHLFQIWGKNHYKLMKDLDFEHMKRAPIASEFKGHLDGNGKTIYNLKIEANGYVGLFKELDGANIKDLTFDTCIIDSKGSYAGVLCGHASNSNIQNIKIFDSHVTTAGNYVGMLCGAVDSSTFLGCSSVRGVVESSASFSGGLIGQTSSSNITQCYSTTNVISTSMRVGGLVGQDWNSSEFDQCFAVSEVTGEDYVAGLIGEKISASPLELKNSYAISKITCTAENARGSGLCNAPQGNITNSYSASTIAAAKKSGTSTFTFSYQNIRNSYFNKELAELDTPAAQARTTEDMYRKLNYINWDFETIWTIDEENDYPKLRFASENDIKDPDVNPESLVVTPDSAQLKPGEALQFHTIVTPSNAMTKKITWISSNPSVLAIDDKGLATAISSGYAAVIAHSKNGCLIAVSNIFVKESENISPQAIASTNSVSSNTYQASKANDGDQETRWLAKSNVSDVYLEFDFNKDVSFSSIKINEFGSRIDSYAIQIWNGNEWTDIHSGQTIGSDFSIQFPKVTASKVRLMVYTTLSSYGPSIYEFEIYN